jgi:pimeloyl-ACP methyl ester carboxylesterase/DNA-binding CsgD family transcriptional regulator
MTSTHPLPERNPRSMHQSLRFCRAADGVRIAYATSGSGPPLVKAAHWLSHLQHEWESPVWRHWLRGLSTGCTLVRYDQRGCGLSDWEVEDWSQAADVSDLEAVVTAAGVEEFALLALSGGGAAAIEYAVRHPERVTHLVLCGCYARGRIAREATEQAKRRGRMMLELIRHGWGQESAAFRQVYTRLFLPDGTPEQIEWFNELQRVSTSPELAARRFESTFHADLSELAPRVQVPTLVLHARRDAVVPFEEGRALAAAIPEARFVPLESCNHVLMEREPAWQAFLDEVRAFLGVSEAVQAAGADRVETASLTRRQREVLELVAEGLVDREIAARLVISEHTVRRHIANILGRLDVSSRAAAVAKALRGGAL